MSTLFSKLGQSPTLRKIGGFVKRRPIVSFFLFNFVGGLAAAPFAWLYIWNTSSFKTSLKLVQENEELQSVIGCPITVGRKRHFQSQGTKSTHKSEQFLYTVVGERGYGHVDAVAETTKHFHSIRVVVTPYDRFNVKHEQISISSVKSLESELQHAK